MVDSPVVAGACRVRQSRQAHFVRVQLGRRALRAASRSLSESAGSNMGLSARRLTNTRARSRSVAITAGQWSLGVSGHSRGWGVPSLEARFPPASRPRQNVRPAQRRRAGQELDGIPASGPSGRTCSSGGSSTGSLITTARIRSDRADPVVQLRQPSNGALGRPGPQRRYGHPAVFPDPARPDAGVVPRAADPS